MKNKVEENVQVILKLLSGKLLIADILTSQSNQSNKLSMVKPISDVVSNALSPETEISLTALTYKLLFLRLTNLWVSETTPLAKTLVSMPVG